MKKLKQLFSILLLILVIQVISYVIFGKSKMINTIGENYETMVINVGGNHFDSFYFITNLDVSEEQIKSNFELMKKREVQICQTIEACPESRDSDQFYIYFIEKEIEIPFLSYSILEGELAKEFGAEWESKYVWMIYKWVLIEKKMTGIS